jgi:hypothetical protein
MKPKAWTLEELNLLEQHYPYMAAIHLQELLPGRSLSSIYKKARYLGVRAYASKEQFITLLRNNHERTVTQLANMAGCSEGTIRYRMHTLSSVI